MIVFGAGSTATWASGADANVLQGLRPLSPDGGRSIGPDVYAAFGRGPEHSVPDHPKDLLLVKDRIVLVPRTEREYLSPPPLEAATAAKDLASLEPADEHQGVRLRYVEGFTIGLHAGNL